MAKNWTVAEAIKAIMNNDKEAISDIGKRFPLFTVSAAEIKESDTGVMRIIEALPERVTVRVIEAAMKGDSENENADSENEEEETQEESGEEKKEVKKGRGRPKGTKKAETSVNKYDGMSARELFNLCKERGLEVKPKLSAEEYVKALKAADKEEEKKDTDKATDGSAYEGMTAMELFKECKKRGIKVEVKKPAKVYVELLEKNDAENAAEEAEDDDWGDGDDTDSAKEVKNDTKKSTKPAKQEEADDDDWDI